MRLHYLSPEKSPKHSLPVIICHAMGLQQRRMGEKWHFQSWLVAMGFIKRDAATQCDCFEDMFDLSPTPSGFRISPVNGMFFNRVRENKISVFIRTPQTLLRISLCQKGIENQKRGNNCLKNETLIRSRCEQVLKNSQRFVLMGKRVSGYGNSQGAALIFGNGSECIFCFFAVVVSGVLERSDK
ncbi:hypothetical protein CEXT_625451 [Caerostris extrusa]|uniref:Uncharacterized protein n=1 Tax=Caerostris extrusa TaxID=172846 RepID=A0AAV4S8K2_CAEEX|nr:hypothetical protein CEXT_625451 [Caerostris extrusa]